MTMLMKFIFLLLLLLANACYFEADQVDTHGLNSNSSSSVAIGEARITSVDVVDDQLIIKGSKLSGVKSIQITGEGNFDEPFEIESKSDSKIIANGLRNISFAVDSLFNLMIADAHGSSIFQIALGIENGSITANKLSSMGAVAGQVLKYDGTEWKPETLSAAGLNYSGNWDATSNSPDLSVGGQPGEYHIVTNAGSYDLNGGAGTNSWAVGDWAVWNDALSQWEKIDNAVSVTSFNGRSGPVTPATNDYTWAQIDKTTSSINDIADVDTSGVSVGQVLKWDGSKWAVANDEQSSGAGSVGSNEIADGSITDTDLAGSISQAKITGLTSSLSTLNTNVTSNATSIGNNSTSISANTSAINGKQDALIDGSAGQFLGTDGSGNFTFQTLTQAMIGLTNVDDIQQLPMSYLDNDDTLAADSDLKVPTQKAIKAYVDGAISGAGGSDNSNSDNVVLNADNDGSTAGEVQLQINGTNQVTIANNGNVGIGSTRTTPASKLDVDGSIRATEICDETGANCRDLSSAAATGDITAVNTTAPLAGGNTSGAISLSLNYDDSTIGINGSSELEVKDNSITDTKLASGINASKITTGTLPDSVLNIGTGNNQLVKLDGSSRLPAVDGSQLTNLPATSDATKLPLVGGTLSGPIAMGTNKITDLSPGTASTDAATTGQMEDYVDASTDEMKTKTSGTYDRDTMSLEALRERINALESAVGSYTWNTISSATTLAVANAYAISGMSVLDLTLPGTCSQGEKLLVSSSGSAKILANTSQRILYLGDQDAITISGIVTIEFTCVENNTSWIITDLSGAGTTIEGELPVCGGAGDSCYENTTAMTNALAITPSGKAIEYVANSLGFYIWKEINGSRLLKATGLDEWQKSLVPDGKNFGSFYTSYDYISGRVCPENVYINDSDKFNTSSCLYYDQGNATQTLNVAGSDGILGFGSWSTEVWFRGNVKTCGDKGMRLPTAFETTGYDTVTSSYYPMSDGTPTVSDASKGLQSYNSGAGYTWTASTFSTSSSNYWRWSSGGDTNYAYTNTIYVVCVLP